MKQRRIYKCMRDGEYFAEVHSYLLAKKKCTRDRDICYEVTTETWYLKTSDRDFHKVEDKKDREIVNEVLLSYKEVLK